MKKPTHTWTPCSNCSELLYSYEGRLHCLECDGDLVIDNGDGTFDRLTGRDKQRSYERVKERSHRKPPLPPPPVPTTALQQRREDLGFFHLALDAPRWVIDAVYRAFATRYHPDKNETDTTDRMREVNERYARIK